MVAAPASQMPRWRTLPWRTSSLIAPMVSSIGTAGSTRWAGNERLPSPRRPAFLFLPIFIPRWPLTSCGSPRRRTGSNGKIWANPILQQPYEVKDGKLHIPDVPGVGLEWDEKAVAAYLADNF